jgi:hypothetical protein
MKLTTSIIVTLLCANLWANEIMHKEVTAHRTHADIQIDGSLDEADWSDAEIANDFIQREPNPGLKSKYKSTVKVLYDNEAIYIGAFLFDPNPDSISQELSERDNFANTDWFGIIIDTYKSGLNAFSFAVTPSGIQSDARLENNRRDDEDWDAVWQSSAQIVANGWIAELKIPYSALRFPKADEQNWYINFGREVRRDREESFWNPIDPQIDQFLSQSGILNGIQNIKPPLRLSAFPFIAAYAENYRDPNGTPKSVWGKSISGGMDVKLGISESFTLDMTLIPDFGQVQSDNIVLNLSPFEVRFDENRQFFTEGTEIFQKAGLFYSRRIGSKPIFYNDIEDNLLDGETVLSNPSETQLYNATKVSGRTKNGTGIGIFNAIVGASEAIIQSEDGSERAVQTNPLSNYSVLVFDQQLKNNSYFSLINTNVWRGGNAYEANASGTEFRLQNNKQTYALRNPNQRSVNGRLSYNRYTPFGKFNRAGLFLFSRYSRIADPNVFSDFNLFLRAFFRTKSFWGTGFNIRWEPINTFDYYEPRTSDFSRFYEYPKNFGVGTFVSSNYNKRFAIDADIDLRWFNEDMRRTTAIEIEPRFRISNQWNLRWSFENEIEKNNIGYVDNVNDEIIFGVRDRHTIVNLLRSNFTFNKSSTVSFRLRHYWSNVVYNRYVQLLDDGSIGAHDYNELNDDNFNAFTIDMVYRWRFAPGSDIFLVWKNSVFSSDELTDISYFRNIDGLFQNPVSNSFSLKCVYFLDYLNLTKRKRSS